MQKTEAQNFDRLSQIFFYSYAKATSIQIFRKSNNIGEIKLLFINIGSPERKIVPYIHRVSITAFTIDVLSLFQPS